MRDLALTILHEANFEWFVQIQIWCERDQRIEEWKRKQYAIEKEFRKKVNNNNDNDNEYPNKKIKFYHHHTPVPLIKKYINENGYIVEKEITEG